MNFRLTSDSTYRLLRALQAERTHLWAVLKKLLSRYESARAILTCSNKSPFMQKNFRKESPVLDDVYSALIKFVKFPHLLREPRRLWSQVELKGRRIALTKNRPLHLGKVSANFLSDCDGDGMVERVILSECGKVWCRTSDVEPVIQHYFSVRKGGGAKALHGLIKINPVGVTFLCKMFR